MKGCMASSTSAVCEQKRLTHIFVAGVMLHWRSKTAINSVVLQLGLYQA